MNSRRGVLLVEINIILVLMGFLCLGFYFCFAQILDTLGRVREDLEIYRVKRIITSVVRRELTYNGALVGLAERDYGTVVISRCIGPRRTISFYRNEARSGMVGLYQNTQSLGKADGINPITPEGVLLTEWTVSALDAHHLLVQFGLNCSGSNRIRQFREVIRLCNGRTE